MANETGDMKLLGSFRKFIDRVKNDRKYQRSNPALTVDAMEAQYAASIAAVQELATDSGASKVVVSERETDLDGLKPLLTRVHNSVKASGAGKSVIEDLSTFKRKLSGARKAPKAKSKSPKGDGEATAASEPDETVKEHSSAQTSYENQLGHFNSYLAVLQNIGSYNPNEEDLKLTALLALRDALQGKNDAVSAAYVRVSQARGQRDELLYAGANSIVETALMGKSYVASAFGKSSQMYKDLAGLQFKRAQKVKACPSVPSRSDRGFN